MLHDLPARTLKGSHSQLFVTQCALLLLSARLADLTSMRKASTLEQAVTNPV